MFGGGNGLSPELLSKLTSGDKNPDLATLLPLLLQSANRSAKQTSTGTAPVSASTAPIDVTAEPPLKKARHFSPILDFADEKIVYTLTLLLQ